MMKKYHLFSVFALSVPLCVWPMTSKAYVFTDGEVYDLPALIETNWMNNPPLLLDTGFTATANVNGEAELKGVGTTSTIIVRTGGNLTFKGTSNDALLKVSDATTQNISIADDSIVTFENLDMIFKDTIYSGSNARFAYVGKNSQLHFIGDGHTLLVDYVNGNAFEMKEGSIVTFKGMNVNIMPRTSTNFNLLGAELYAIDSNFHVDNVLPPGTPIKPDPDTDLRSVAGMTLDNSGAIYSDAKFISTTGDHVATFNNHNWHGVGTYGGDILFENMSIEASNIHSTLSGSTNVLGTGMRIGGEGGVITIKGDGRQTLTFKNNQHSGLYLEVPSYGSISNYDPDKFTYLIENMQIINEGHQFVYVENGGLINIKNSTLNMLADDVAFHMTGKVNDTLNIFNNNGTIKLENVTMTGDNTVLYQNDAVRNFTKDGYFDADDSTLRGAILDKGKGHVDFDTVTWDMVKSSEVYDLATKDTSIDMRSKTAGQFNTLTIRDSISGNNTTIDMNADLLNEQADKIILEDGATATGTTTLRVLKTSTPGQYGPGVIPGQDGLVLVEARGNALAADGTFKLYGDVLDTQAYIYTLEHGDLGGNGDSYYLRATTDKSAVARNIEDTPAIHINMLTIGMNELRMRLGELRYSMDCYEGLWARTYAKRLKIDDNATSKMNLYGIEAGYDHTVYHSEDNRFLVGATTGFAFNDNIRVKQNNGYLGSGHSKAFSVGLYTTWLNKNGWFIDLIGRYFWSDMKMHTPTLNGQMILHNGDRNYFTGSFEVGKRWYVPLNGDNNRLMIGPKIELVYAYAPSENFGTNFNDRLHYDKTESFITHAAIELAYEFKTKNSDDFNISPFIQFGVLHEWNGKTKIRYMTSDLESDLHGTTYEFIAGVNAKLSDRWNLYSDVTYETGNIIKSIGGHLGIRYDFGCHECKERSSFTTASPLLLPMPVAPTTVTFDFDSDRLSEDAQETLNEFSETVGDKDGKAYQLEGHTDIDGPPDYNEELSKRRANSVRSFMVEKGFNPENIETDPKAYAIPVAPNSTPKGRAANRRVEIHEKDKGEAK